MKEIITEIPQTLRGYRVVQNEQEAIEALRNGETIARYEYGNSMSPMLSSGEYCIISPCTEADKTQIKQGDALFCSVHGYPMTHMVWLVSDASETDIHFLIGSSRGELYGWADEIYGLARGSGVIQASPSYVEDMEIIDNV